jgi:hypothetical protein
VRLSDNLLSSCVDDQAKGLWIALAEAAGKAARIRKMRNAPQ